MTERPHSARWRDRSGVLVVAVAVTALCWIVGNPRSSGPDEPSHMVASAGLVRGERHGRDNPDPALAAYHLFDVPGMVGEPNPGCWAMHPEVPVACASTGPLSTDTAQLTSLSFNYPPWAMLLPGLASFAPSAGGYAYLARVLSSAIPIALVCGALIALVRRRAVAAASALLGLTPIVWFTFGFMSPSAMAIGGGLALWTGLLVHQPRLTTWLTVGGWAALLLARRDGPVWATLIVLACCLLTELRPWQLWHRLEPWARWAVVALAPIPVLTPLVNDGDGTANLLLSFAPLAIVVVELLARRYARLTSNATRIGLVGCALAAAALLAVGLVLNRPGGYRADLLRLVMLNTGDHLRQLVGILGWLDTPVPMLAVFLFWAMLGGLAVVALLELPRAAAVFVACLVTAIVMAWLLELGQGLDYGNYWQGRYTMPFAVGFPLLLTWRPSTATWLDDRLAMVVAWSSWVVSNLAFLAAQQRWGVGTNGSWYPWDWDTWGAPVTPWVLVLLHGAATAVLATCCTTERVRVTAAMA